MSEQGKQAERYAKAIMQAMVERWQSTLVKIESAVEEDDQLAQTLSDRQTDLDAKMSALSSAVDVELSPEMQNLLKLLLQEDDIQMLSEVSAALGQVASGRQAPLKAEVTSAVPLSDDDKRQMREKLTNEYGDGLIFDFRTDESLLGGLRVRVGDRLIDTSVASRLAAMRERLVSAVR